MNLNKKLTKSAFRQKADRILMRLSMDVTPFWEDTEDKRERRLKKAAADPLYFCRTLFIMSWCGSWKSGARW
jgi:hypothetical protein